MSARKGNTIAHAIKNIATAVFGTVMLAVIVLSLIPNSFSINSGSMEPTIPTGAWILTQPQDVATNPYTPDEIITFYVTEEGDDEPRIVTHRLLDVAPDGTLITKGDANGARDYPLQPTTQEDVIGKVVFQVPLIGIPILLFGAIMDLLLAGNLLLWGSLLALVAAAIVIKVFFGEKRQPDSAESEENEDSQKPTAQPA